MMHEPIPEPGEGCFMDQFIQHIPVLHLAQSHHVGGRPFTGSKKSLGHMIELETESSPVPAPGTFGREFVIQFCCIVIRVIQILHIPKNNPANVTFYLYRI